MDFYILRKIRSLRKIRRRWKRLNELGSASFKSYLIEDKENINFQLIYF